MTLALFVPQGTGAGPGVRAVIDLNKLTGRMLRNASLLGTMGAKIGWTLTNLSEL